MANISVRNLDDSIRDTLRDRAAQHGHSMEAEIRQILTEAARPPVSDPFLELARRSQEAGGVDLETRSATPEDVPDFSGPEFA